MSLDHKVVFSESIGPGRSGATSRLSAADSHSGDILQQVGVYTLFKHLMANATLFDLLFHILVLSRVHFIYSNFAWLCGREVVWLETALT
jgi:hypothetical protein